MHKTVCGLLIACLLATGCGDSSAPGADEFGFTRPTEHTREANRQVLRERPFSDRRDFKDAQRGLVARQPSLQVFDENEMTVWDQDAYGFISGEAPDSVNPSLWRQAQLNNLHGLYRVTEGVYQLRGHDLANMTLIEGDSGWIVVDPLTARETAEAAMQLARQHLDDRPVVAVLFTHSHIDHFGGVLGVISAAQAREQKVRIIAPRGFMDEVTSENVIAGLAMGRRAQFMYGSRLPRSPRGHVDSGLGKAPAIGAPVLLQAAGR